MTYRSKIDGQSSEIALTKLTKKRGPLKNSHQVPVSIINEYEGRLPNILLDYWQYYGIGEFGDGRARFVVTKFYANVVEWLFRGDPDFSGDCHVIVLGAFGDMMIWSERYQLIFVTLPLAIVDAHFRSNPLPADQVDRFVLNYVLNVDQAVFDTLDDTGKPMFERSLTLLGPLQPSEIYGTVPALTFEEPLDVDMLAKVDAQEWLIEKMAGTKFSLADLEAGRLDIRQIGSSAKSKGRK